MAQAEAYVVDFPTLWVAADWIENHCVIPDGFHKGNPFILTSWQLWLVNNHYRLKRDAPLPDAHRPAIGASAFFYRRMQVVLPQKAGKGPVTAAIVLLEGCGPTMFTGWATGGEEYRCADHGCPCGWVYEYRPGEAMAVPRPTSLIQLTAFSYEQVGNVYDALRPMVEDGPLSEVIPATGEAFTRLPNGGRIDVVTSSQRSRLGQRVTYVVQDEALALDTPLPTPLGWTTMGEVKVGDMLVSADGRPTAVTRATEIQIGRTCYRVHFEDGTSLVASDGHRWLTRISASPTSPRIRTTGEMVADGRRFRVPAGRAFDLPEAQLPVDPYFLGAWLGDGATGKCEITAGDVDVEEMQRLLAEVNVATVVRRYGVGHAPTLCFSAKVGYQGSKRPAVAKALGSMACFRSKHIPEEYLRGSRGQREALLQGLMDTDGHITEAGYCTFAGNERLAKDVVRLLRTLGIRSRAVRRADPRAHSGFGWKVNFTPRDGVIPFRMKRKADRVRQAHVSNDWVSIVAVEPVDSVPVRCVGVDADDHLFLAGEGAQVTHNTGIWLAQNRMDEVAKTQRRGVAGMQGRLMETTNAWDPSENSVAQTTHDAALKVEDIFRLHPLAPSGLSFRNKVERRRILRHVYDGSPWIDIDGTIEPEALELIQSDPGNAERFFGNRIVAGLGAWLKEEQIDKARFGADPADGIQVVPPGTAVAVGFDGSESDDWTALTCETKDGYSFVPRYGPDHRPAFWNPSEWGGSIPRAEVDAAVHEIATTYRMRRMYADPRDWRSEIGAWALKYGDEVVFEFDTYVISRMYPALYRFRTDLIERRIKLSMNHDGDQIVRQHLLNARKAAKPGDKYLLVKPDRHRKIDLAMTAVLAHEAAADLHAEAAWGEPSAVRWAVGKTWVQ